MSGWGDPDGPNKRRAEHTLQVANKRHHLGDVNPGREYVEPRVYQQPNYDPYDEEQQQQVRANGCQTVLPGRNLQILLLAACCKLANTDHVCHEWNGTACWCPGVASSS